MGGPFSKLLLIHGIILFTNETEHALPFNASSTKSTIEEY